MRPHPVVARRHLTVFAASVSLLLSLCLNVHADTVITSIPYTITQSGTYVLESNLNSAQTSGQLISIQTSNVTIDFQNHYIAAGGGGASQSAIGVYSSERSNVTVKNGTIAYCRVGINLSGNGTATTNSVNHVIDRMRVTYCTYIGINITNGPASRITNCQVSQGGYNGQSFAGGISASGAMVTIRGNTVSNIVADTSYGIYMDTGGIARQNTISGAGCGVGGGKYQDNLTANCVTPYAFGTDAGGNN